MTGGGRGIGKGISHALAEAGAAVICTGRTSAPLEATAAAIRAQGGRALALPADITEPGAAQAIATRAVAEFGRLDSWVNNAGSASSNDVGPLLELTEPQWDNVVDLNLKWAFFAAQAAARAMTEGGSIINISSRSGSHPNPMTGQYGAAKAGVENLTTTMAVEWGHMGIRVNAIAPGVVLTEEFADLMSGERAQKQIDTVPLGRLGTPADIGPLCVYLAADESAWISGTVIQAHGGSRIPIGYMAYLHKIAKGRREAAAGTALPR
ncbi:short-chain dehydrogenase [Chelatococcus reniformis]|uniref:Short-chain dehydrogenase n=1 Tax=Chelatococcus reniformis TaxID=1494448 RepID=A0A916XNC2_9HYPH|nr:short-chain dehydrogenase [Chelatococcus reniformis]